MLTVMLSETSTASAHHSDAVIGVLQDGALFLCVFKNLIVCLTGISIPFVYKLK